MQTKAVQVLGRINRDYTFTNMADFQMIPLMKREPNSDTVEYVYDDLVPQKIDSSEMFVEVNCLNYAY